MFQIHIHKTHGDFSLDVSGTSSARVLGVVGPSGSGKSTLLNVIAGFVPPDEASVCVGESWLVHSSDAVRHTPTRRRGVGYVCQSPLLFPHMTVHANLTYGLAAHGTSPPLEHVVAVLELAPLLEQPARTLSGGEARRVAIGRAIMSAPRVMLLDEPLSGLDARLAQRTLALLHRMGESFHIPTIYVSHTMSDVIFLCDDLWRLDGGRLVATGRPRDVLADARCGGPGTWADLRNLFVAAREADPVEHLAAYRIGDQCLVLADARASVGAENALLSIHASDILLARDRPTRISARNVLAGRVIRVAEHEGAVLVGVDVGVEWMVRLTPAAVRALDITMGVNIFAIVKASAISAVSV